MPWSSLTVLAVPWEGLHEKYPLLQKYLDQGEMVLFLRDREIEVRFLDKNSNEQSLLQRRKSNQDSDVSESLLTLAIQARRARKFVCCIFVTSQEDVLGVEGQYLAIV